MINLFSFCDCHWLLPWILPFLLGLLLGWLIWGRLLAGLRSRISDLEGEIRGYKKTIADLEADLDACRKKRAALEGDLALCRGRISEMEATPKAKMAAVATPTPPPAPKATGAQGIAAVPTPAPAAKAGKYAKLKSDNLQVIEGIGPKMESVCKDAGIDSWSSLASKSEADLQGVLGKYGDKYRIIDPSEWPAQAALARDGQWDDLITMQKGIGGDGTTVTDSKVEKIMIKLGIIKQWKENDLKAVEGIGPKIEGLLNAAGINTWSGLAGTSVDRIKEILAAAGKRYQLADPGTWPQQAGLAADGKWDELEALQDALDGGR